LVIPVHNQNTLYYQTLKSIFETYPVEHTIHVHVIDAASEQPIKFPQMDHYPNLEATLTRLQENHGVTYPWNLGLRYGMALESDVICISNSDVIFGPEAIRHCLDAIESGKQVVFPQTNEKKGDPDKEFERLAEEKSKQPLLENLKDTGGFAGWCFFLSKEVIEKIGYFDPQFVLWYGDTDYHWRLAKEKIRPVEVQNCLLHHYESRTILSMPDGFECHGWRARDEKRFFKKWPSE